MRYLFLLLLTLYSLSVFSQENQVWMHANSGQWGREILYKMDLSMGEMMISKEGFCFSLNNIKPSHSHEKEVDDKYSIQIIKSRFLNSQWQGEKRESKKSNFYRNYFLGNDESKWKSKIYSFQSVELLDYYKKIDLLFETSHQFEYSFKVAPKADINQIQYQIEGANKIDINEKGNLIITTNFGEIIESKPIAWNVINGEKKYVVVDFRLKNSIISFDFPSGYNHDYQLVIDPTLTFSSFTGSTLDNWGMTATPDPNGNLFAGGIVFTGSGSYPTTTGSYDLTYNGGSNYTYTLLGGTYSNVGFDIALSKFNSTGTALIYSTYLGGSGNEAPHSLISNANGDLFLFGVTSSANFPVSSTAYDNSFNAGPYVAENELGYNAGADLFVTHFNASGSALIGSTFVGGSGTDGINIGELNYNYGDSFRGEIIIDNQGNVIVSSTTQSTNFPTVNASQNALNGIQDAVLFKMNSNLSTMIWSTYFGGSGLESGNSVQISSNGFVYLTGGTNSPTLPFNSGQDLTFNGGISDGYVVRMSAVNNAILSGTFLGLNEYDQVYFVQLDLSNNVYLYGQTESAWTITSGLYGTPNSGQFIRKYNNSLTTILWTTMIGAGTGNVEISPTAFLVSNCGEIYIAGWGGAINTSYSNQARYSTTNGFTVTSDAYQSITNGSNFYIALLGQNASILKYATFIGGVSTSYNHVDGGTSRFDKNGKIYHAVCAACGGDDNGFTSTPGVFSPTNNSPNCNLAAFKFELNSIQAVVSAPSSIICIPDPVIFQNNSQFGNYFQWTFGDGSGSTLQNPSHLYQNPGTYTVTLIVSDTNNCFLADSTTFQVEIGNFEGGVVQPVTPICFGETYQLEAYGGLMYSWTPANVLNDPTSPTPIATISETTLFTVVVSDSCGIDTVQVTLEVYPTIPVISNDTSLCIGESVQLFVSNTISQVWSPSNSLNNSTIYNPISTPTNTTTYTVEVETIDHCKFTKNVEVVVFLDIPIPIISDTLKKCLYDTVIAVVSGAEYYSWENSSDITILNQLKDSIVISTIQNGYYWCDFTNACGTIRDSLYILNQKPNIIAGNDTTICPKDTVVVWASGGVSYSWSPIATVQNSYEAQTQVYPKENTTYFVIGKDEFGCLDTAQVHIAIFPQPYVQACPDVYAFVGDQVQLYATSNSSGNFYWSPIENLSCSDCPRPIADPFLNSTYTVTLVDENGCKATDDVSIFFDGLIFVPNTFTPDGNQINKSFNAVAGNIEEFELNIFNRWGEIIFTSYSLEDSWDGTYNNLPCPIGTYTWKIRYKDYNNKVDELVGHINIVR